MQPNEVFSYVEGCSGEYSLGGAGFAQGGSSGPLATLPPEQYANWGGGTGLYIGGSDKGGEAGGGGGASALCVGASSAAAPAQPAQVLSK